MTEESNQVPTEMTQPIIIEMGEQKNTKIKELKKGKGKLWDEVLSVVEETRDMLGGEAEGKILVPVIMIYNKKTKRQGLDKLISRYLK